MSAAWAADFSHASAYVAKAYTEERAGGWGAQMRRDVRMQCEAKAWSNRYNAQSPRPPKPVDFLTAFLLELVDRPGRPVFACERMISGTYVKHNSNSGVCPAAVRCTRLGLRACAANEGRDILSWSHFWSHF